MVHGPNYMHYALVLVCCSVGDCVPATGVCARDPRFRKGHEFTYWAPLEFAADGAILPFKPFQRTVAIQVKTDDDFTIVHNTPRPGKCGG